MVRKDPDHDEVELDLAAKLISSTCIIYQV
jgi:hypothetical protein